MAYQTTQNFRNASLDNNKKPNLLIDIENYPYQFGWFKDNKTLKFDDGYNFDEGLFFDTLVENNNTLPLLSVDGTSKSLTQQLDQDRGTGSTPSMTIALVDLNGAITNIFGNDELLGVNANVYLSYAGLEHPNDSIRIFSGTITDVSQTAGLWKLKVDNPDQLKEQTLFVPFSDELTAAIDDTVITISVSDTSTFIEEGGKLSSYIRIEDELMRVTGIAPTSFTVTRGALLTTAVSHDDESEVTSIYVLTGNPLDLALELMLSSQGLEPYYTEYVSEIGNNNNLILDVFNAGDEKGISPGDTLEIAGSSGADGTYTVISTTLTDGALTSIQINPAITPANFLVDMTATFYTQYNNLPEGCAMDPSEVDVAQHQFIQSTFGAPFPDVEFRLEDEINAKEFIEEEIYKPLGGYFLTRKGRASIGYTAASVALSESVTLNSSNIKNPSKLSPKRSTSKAFYNSVLHKFGYDLLRDKFLKVIISQSEESVNRIRRGRKTLTVEAKGFKNDTATTSFFNDVSLRLLDRYRYAATTLTVQPTYGIGLNIEVGDSVVFDGRGLNVFDSLSGTNDSFQRVMEVINKKLDVTSGNVSLTLLDTNFGVADRFGVFGPSSFTNSDSTTTRIKIKKSYFTPELEQEFEKWIEFADDTPIKISSPDFSFSESTTLTGIDQSDTNFLLIDPPLSTPPLEDYRVELADYDESDDRTKLLYPSFCYSVDIVSGIDDKNFTVDGADIGKFFVGGVLQISNDDFSQFVQNVVVESILGNTITTVDSIGFTPTSANKVSGGFASDNGGNYTYF